MPLLLLGLGVLALAGLGWLLGWWARSSAGGASVLRSTGLERLEGTEEGAANMPLPGVLLSNPPGAIWWLSFAWLEGGVWGFGALMQRLGMRFGGLMARLEGRFYLPLALILALIALLVASR